MRRVERMLLNLGCALTGMVLAHSLEARRESAPEAPASGVATRAVQEGLFGRVNALHQAGDFSAAAAELRSRAMDGEATAQFAYALALQIGAGVSMGSSVDWLIRATDAGYRPAALHLLPRIKALSEYDPERAQDLAARIKRTLERPQPFREEIPAAFGTLRKDGRMLLSLSESVKWNRQRASAGDGSALYSLGILAPRRGVSLEEVTRQAAAAGSVEAQYVLASDAISLSKLGVDEYLKRLSEVDETFADVGHGGASLSVAKRLKEKWGREDLGRRERLLRVAIASGEAEAVGLLATVLLSGSGYGPEAHAEGVRLLRQAVRLRLEDAAFDLAFYLANGPDSVRRPDEARSLLRKLAESGTERAAAQLARLLEGDPDADEEVHGLLKQAAERGDASAWLPYGQRMLAGRAGAERDPAQAFSWIERSARVGVAEAQLRIGVMLLEGVGIERDPEEAATWLRLASDKRNVEAMVRLALLLDKGEGVEPSRKEADQLRKRAEGIVARRLGKVMESSEAVLARLREGEDTLAFHPERMVLITAAMPRDPGTPIPPEVAEAAEELLAAGYERARFAMIAVRRQSGQMSPDAFVELAEPLLETDPDLVAGPLLFAKLESTSGRWDAADIEATYKAWEATGDPEAELIRREMGLKFMPEEMTDEAHAAAIAALGDRGPDADFVLLHRPPPVYPIALRQAGIAGSARVRITVDVDGTVEEAEVLSETHILFGFAARDAVLAMRFAPAIKAGKPARTYFEVPFSFNLREGDESGPP